MQKQAVHSSDAPAPVGPYSQAIRAGDTVYCSGQIALDPETGTLVSGNIQRQTRQVLESLGMVLKGAGLGFTDVVSVAVFMTDLCDFAKMNEVYASYFTQMPPARCVVEVSGLPKDASIEISLVAVQQ